MGSTRTTRQLPPSCICPESRGSRCCGSQPHPSRQALPGPLLFFSHLVSLRGSQPTASRVAPPFLPGPCLVPRAGLSFSKLLQSSNRRHGTSPSPPRPACGFTCVSCLPAEQPHSNGERWWVFKGHLDLESELWRPAWWMSLFSVSQILAVAQDGAIILSAHK